MSSRFVFVGIPEGRRVTLFQEALVALDLPPATVIPYRDLLSGAVTLPDIVREGDIVRFDSPGRDWETEKALLAYGAEAAEAEGFASLTAAQVGALVFDKGEILCPRQWYLGYRRLLQWLEEQLADCPPHRRMNDTAEIALMFDKIACHAHMEAQSISVPSAQPVAIRGFHDLIATGWRQAFVKLAHGSSASGVVAFRTDGRQRFQTITTVEMVGEGESLRLFNSRRIRTYEKPEEVAALIDALCRHRVHVEQWLPKASYDGQVFDLRVMMIAGQVRHTVVRRSHTPITNLHLLNDRDDTEAVRELMTPESWAALEETCKNTMTQCFPRSLYAGLDVLVTAGFRHHAVLEANAFGDLLPGSLHAGEDTYVAQIREILSA